RRQRRGGGVLAVLDAGQIVGRERLAYQPLADGAVVAVGEAADQNRARAVGEGGGRGGGGGRRRRPPPGGAARPRGGPGGGGGARVQPRAAVGEAAAHERVAAAQHGDLRKGTRRQRVGRDRRPRAEVGDRAERLAAGGGHARRAESRRSCAADHD